MSAMTTADAAPALLLAHYPEHANVEELFTSDVAKHALTVKLDDGAYRHLLFRDPENSWYWFELVTWPGALTISGDMGTYTFRRDPDMFKFFESGGHSIDLRYWAEKVQENRDEVRAYSQQAFERRVQQAYDEWVEWSRPSEADALAASEGVRELLSQGEDEHLAHDALSSFEGAGGFESYMWEWDQWDLRDYTYRFVWVCLALRWGIAQYRSRPPRQPELAWQGADGGTGD